MCFSFLVLAPFLLLRGLVKPEGVGTSRIFRDRAPLELAGAVILLIAAFVVYNGITVRIRHKHFCDEQVNLHIAAVQAYSQITAPIVKRL